MQLAFHPTAAEAIRPVKSSAKAAAFDLFEPSTVTILPGEKYLSDLLVRCDFPTGHCGLLKMRSGAAKRLDLVLQGGLIGESSDNFRD
jgi:dUTPase